MPGPLPKDPAIRQRRNKQSTRALLPVEQPKASPAKAESTTIAQYPALPTLPHDGPWHPLTVRWWDDVWTSPMHQEFLRADQGALFRLAWLVDSFWKTHSMKAAVEIRLMEREFGLTPMGRRRLEWTVAQSQQAAAPAEAKKAKRPRVVENDPRGVLDK